MHAQAQEEWIVHTTNASRGGAVGAAAAAAAATATTTTDATREQHEIQQMAEEETEKTVQQQQPMVRVTASKRQESSSSGGGGGGGGHVGAITREISAALREHYHEAERRLVDVEIRERETAEAYRRALLSYDHEHEMRKFFFHIFPCTK